MANSLFQQIFVISHTVSNKSNLSFDDVPKWLLWTKKKNNRNSDRL